MTEQAQEQEVDLSGIDPSMHEVVRTHGREMFALVMAAGMSQEALARLASFAEKHRSRHSAHAVAVLAQSFNEVANGLIKAKGWTEEQLAQCDRDIQRAFAGKLAVPSPSIILPH